jgi:quercetin dioxygenase-like cupin family protein
MPGYDLSDPECRLALVDYAPYTRMPVHDHPTLGLAIVLRGKPSAGAPSRRAPPVS